MTRQEIVKLLESKAVELEQSAAKLQDEKVNCQNAAYYLSLCPDLPDTPRNGAVTLHLTENQAAVLHSVLRCVDGPQSCSPRLESDQVLRMLVSKGVGYDDSMFSGTLHSKE